MDWSFSADKLARPALALVFAALVCVPQTHAQSRPGTQSATRAALTTPIFGLPTGDRQSRLAGQPTHSGDLRRSATPSPSSGPASANPPDFNQSTIRADTPALRGAANAGGQSSITEPPNDALGSLDTDQRAQQDRDVFERPFAGNDPEAFQIESLNPVRDRRTRAFFEDQSDPFAHIGWRLGSFILFQELEVAASWDSNVFFDTNPRSDWNGGFDSETRIVSNWSNHALEFRMLHDRDYYSNFSSENGTNQTYELRGRLDITSRTSAEALASREIGQESRNSIDAGGNSTTERPDVTTDRLTAAFNHRFNRLSLQLRGGHAATDYEQRPGDAANNRDVRIQTVALRAQWEFRPTFSVFGEVEHNQRDRKSAAISDGLSRNSDGERYRAGVALGQTGEFLRGEASIGYGVQRPDAAQLPDVQAFLVDANVAWRITPLTSLLFDASTAVDETTVAGSSGVVSRRIGVRARHAFTERLTGETGISYATQAYQGATLKERSTALNLNVEYTLNRHAALFSRLDHTRFRSTGEDRDYNATTVMFGARLRN